MTRSTGDVQLREAGQLVHVDDVLPTSAPVSLGVRYPNVLELDESVMPGEVQAGTQRHTKGRLDDRGYSGMADPISAEMQEAARYRLAGARQRFSADDLDTTAAERADCARAYGHQHQVEP